MEVTKLRTSCDQGERGTEDPVLPCSEVKRALEATGLGGKSPIRLQNGFISLTVMEEP